MGESLGCDFCCLWGITYLHHPGLHSTLLVPPPTCLGPLHLPRTSPPASDWRAHDRIVGGSGASGDAGGGNPRQLEETCPTALSSSIVPRTSFTCLGALGLEQMFPGYPLYWCPPPTCLGPAHLPLTCPPARASDLPTCRGLETAHSLPRPAHLPRTCPPASDLPTCHSPAHLPRA